MLCTSMPRRPARTTPLAALALVTLIAVAAAGLGQRSSASAEAPAGTTLTYTEPVKGSTFRHIRNTKTTNRRANLLGDLIVFANPISDSTGKRVGKSHVQCVTTVGASNFKRSKLTCTGVSALRQGTLTLAAIVSPGARTTTGAVTGGTGAYANARGVFSSVLARNGDAATTITLAP